jgi:lysophospholipase L1-like esterase
MDRNRRLAVVVVGVVVALVAIAAIADAATSNEGDKVLILGDSITAITGKDLAKDLEPAYDVTLRAKFGATVQEMMPYAKEVAPQKPDQVVIDLGSNDALGQKPIQETSQQLHELVGLFPDAECIELVNINTKMRHGNQSRTKEAQAINKVLEDIAAADGRISIVDWDSKVSDDLVDDTVHPNKKGQEVLAQLMDDALGRCGRPWKFW